MLIPLAAQRAFFIQAMLEETGGAWPDLEELIAAIYAAYLRPGDIALDIGVNHGVHLVRMAELVGSGGQVIGVEPVPAFSRHARERLVAGGRDLASRVVMHDCAVGAEAGHADFFVTSITDGGLSGLRLRSVIADAPFERIRVDVRTLDALLPDGPVRFVKIDIEGGEYDALRGAPRLLAQQPVIAFEFDRSAPAAFGFEADDLHTLLVDAGYRIHDIFGIEVDSGDALMNAMVWNFLAIPRDLDPGAIIAPAQALLESRNHALAPFATSPPSSPDLV